MTKKKRPAAREGDRLGERLNDNLTRNRETWLRRATHLMRPEFAKIGEPLHEKIRIAVGFPLGGFERTVKGQCFAQSVSRDGHNEIFVSPLVDDPLEVFGILVHELCHAQDNGESGHGPAFARRAHNLDLEGPPRSACAGESTRKRYADLLRKLGNYPHAAMNPQQVKRQPTRMIKCTCPICGYTTRTTQKWITISGGPFCSTCTPRTAATVQMTASA